jgi:hypothetical protein
MKISIIDLVIIVVYFYRYHCYRLIGCEKNT